MCLTLDAYVWIYIIIERNTQYLENHMFLLNFIKLVISIKNAYILLHTYALQYYMYVNMYIAQSDLINSSVMSSYH